MVIFGPHGLELRDVRRARCLGRQVCRKRRRLVVYRLDQEVMAASAIERSDTIRVARGDGVG